MLLSCHIGQKSDCFRDENEYNCDGPIQLPPLKALQAAQGSPAGNEKTATNSGPKTAVPSFVTNEDGDYLFTVMVEQVNANTQPFTANITVEFKGTGISLRKLSSLSTV